MCSAEENLCPLVLYILLVGCGRRKNPPGSAVASPVQLSRCGTTDKGRRVAWKGLLHPVCWTKRGFSVSERVAVSSYSFDYRTITPQIRSSPCQLITP